MKCCLADLAFFPLFQLVFFYQFVGQPSIFLFALLQKMEVGTAPKRESRGNGLLKASYLPGLPPQILQILLSQQDCFSTTQPPSLMDFLTFLVLCLKLFTPFSLTSYTSLVGSVSAKYARREKLHIASYYSKP